MCNQDLSDDERIVYSINVADIQGAAEEELGRYLNAEELRLVEDKLGDYIAWYEAIISAMIAVGCEEVDTALP
jgi:hypothetical protein